MTGSDFTVERERDIILVTDLDRGGRSVTNDAAWVVGVLGLKYPDLRYCTVLYRDSMGFWDQLVLSRHGQFARFHPVRAATRKAALAWAVQQAAREDEEW